MARYNVFLLQPARSTASAVKRNVALFLTPATNHSETATAVVLPGSRLARWSQSKGIVRT